MKPFHEWSLRFWTGLFVAILATLVVVLVVQYQDNREQQRIDEMRDRFTCALTDGGMGCDD